VSVSGLSRVPSPAASSTALTPPTRAEVRFE
jgi:hypothetical protein